MTLVRRAWDAVAGLGALGRVLGGLGVLAGIVLWLWAWLGDHSIPGWLFGAVVFGLALLAIGAYLLGRRSFRALPQSAAQRARDELAVARVYLQHTLDFLGLLRESMGTVDTPPEEGIRRVDALRDLVFTAIGQGIKTQPGEIIRCALFEPIEERGQPLLRVREGFYHGHTDRVRELRLHMGSVAGRAYTEKREIYVPDAGTNPMVQPTREGREMGTLCCLPAYGFGRAFAGEPIGVFSVTSNQPDALSLSDRRFIRACADLLGLIGLFRGIYEYVRQQQELPEQAGGS